MSKQTAVEWLSERLIRMIPTINPIYKKDIDTYLQQAKEMEKEQIMDIDYRLSVIEDYAKGEVGDEITKLRSELEEYYGK